MVGPDSTRSPIERFVRTFYAQDTGFPRTELLQFRHRGAGHHVPCGPTCRKSCQRKFLMPARLSAFLQALVFACPTGLPLNVNTRSGCLPSS